MIYLCIERVGKKFWARWETTSAPRSLGMEFAVNLHSVASALGGAGQIGEGEASQVSQRGYGVSTNRLRKSTLQTYETYRQHKEVGDNVRMEANENRAARQEQEAKRIARGRQEWENRQKAREEVRRARHAVLVARFEQSDKLHEEKAAIRERVDSMKQQAKDWGREMALIEKVRVSKADNAEKENAKQLRLESSQMRLELSQGAKNVRQHLVDTKRRMAASVRQARDTRVAAATAQVARDKILSGKAVREEAKDAKAVRESQAAQYLEFARASQAETAALRAKIKEVSRREFRRRKEQADRVREEDYSGVAGDRYYDELEEKARKAADIYAQRFGGENEGADWSTSPIGKLHEAARWAKDIIGSSIWGVHEKSVAEEESKWKYTSYGAGYVSQATGTR